MIDPKYHPLLEEVKHAVINNTAFNPTNDDYDHSAFISFVNQAASQYVTDIANNSAYKGLISEIIFCFLKINEEYEGTMEKIEELLDTLDLDDMVLIEAALILTNIQYFDVTKITDADILGDSRKLSLVDINSPKRKSAWGQEIFLQDAVEIGVDSFNQAVSIIKSYNQGNKTELDEAGISGVRELLMLCNLLYLLKDVFHQYAHEFKHIFLTNGKIVFTDPTNYIFLKRVGKQRFKNHLLELSIRMNFQPSIDKSPLLHKVSDNTIKFSEHDTSSYQKHRQFNLGILIYHKFYLRSTKLPKLGGVTINELYDVIVAIQAALSKITSNEDIRNEIKNGNVKKLPIKLNKKSLIKYLQKLTGVNNSVVQTILECITSVPKEDFDGWKTPIMTYGGHLFFLLGSLENGHQGYLMDVVLSKIYDIAQENSHFSIFVQKEINSKENSYPLQSLDTSIVKDLEFFLLKLTDRKYVAIQTKVYQFPIDIKDYGEALKHIVQAIVRLNKNVDVYWNQVDTEERGDVEIAKVIVCNYPFLSGLVIDNCHVVDTNLLSNYLSTGKFVRGKMNTIHGLKQVGVAAEYEYYTSKEQFQNRFIDFINNPTPIDEASTLFISKEFQVAEQFFNAKIINDDTAEATYSQIEEIEIDRLKTLLRNHYYFESDIDADKVHAQEQFDLLIKFHLPYVFSIVAFEDKDRTVRIRLIESIKETGLRGLAYVLALVGKLAASSLNKQPKKAEDSKESSPIDTDMAASDYAEVVKSLARDGEVKLSLSTLDIAYPLSDPNRQNLIDFLIAGVSIQMSREISLDSLEDSYTNINILAGLFSYKKGYDINFIRLCLNFIDQLNNNFYYQKARNFAEEMLKYYCDKGESPLLGWLFQMRCFTKQNNIPDAACYAALLLSVVDTYGPLEVDLYFEICYNLMLFHRARGDEDDTKVFFEILKEITTEEYELHKIHLSYYVGLLTTNKENLADTAAQIKNYLSENLNAILQYNEKGAFPWIALIYNVKNIIGSRYIEEDNFWDVVLSSLEKEISEVELKKWQAIFFNRKEDTIDIFKAALLHTFETMNVEDLVYEIRNISLLALNTIENAIATEDVNSLLLAGLVINDQMLTFQIKPWQEYTQFNTEIESELKDHIDNYTDFVLDRKVMQNGQYIYWIFNHYSSVYCLIMGNKEDVIIPLPNWDLEKMRAWRVKSSDFYFPPGQDYFINQQEADYIKTLESLQLFELPVMDDCTEVLLYYSLDIAIYPHNLLTVDVSKFPTKTFSHEEIVQEKINTTHRDFASLYFPIVNIGSIEWFKNNNSIVNIDSKNYSIELWSPVDDEDFVLALTLEKTTPVIVNLPVKRIVTTVIPEPELSSNFNIFIAHGGKNLEGFKTVYTKDAGGKAFIKHSGISALFGSGDVAIVFICNSALIAKEVYAERLISFTNEILLLGYKAVIAPAWSLNPDIVPHWLEAFFENLQQGKSINQAVFFSNAHVAKHGYNEYSGFYAPTGWASMHLYGNPNVYLK